MCVCVCVIRYDYTHFIKSVQDNRVFGGRSGVDWLKLGVGDPHLPHLTHTTVHTQTCMCTLRLSWKDKASGRMTLVCVCLCACGCV